MIQGLLKFLEFAFKDSPILPMIDKKWIWLFTPGAPANEQAKR
jgi:hypothetical protein